MDKTMLNDATSSDDSPTPGYMLTDISRNTLANYQACIALEDYLVSRLSKKNHNIKYKCLMIMKHVCRTGRVEFKRDMARKSDAIKECLQFTGPPDPLRGDEIYKRVREAAREALDAIFDSQMPVSTTAVAAANRIQGMSGGYVDQTAAPSSTASGMFSSVVSAVSSLRSGASSNSAESGYTGHPGAEGSFGDRSGFSGAGSGLGSSISNNASSGPYPAGSSSSSGMVGFGNPNFSDARTEKSLFSKLSEKVSNISFSLSSGSSDKSKTFLDGNNGTDEYKFTSNRGPNAYNSSYGGYTPSGGGFNSSPSSTSSNPAYPSNFGASNYSASVVPDIPLNGNGLGRAGTAAADGSYEVSIIESLCEAGGTKAVPAEDKLAVFLTSAPNLAPEVVGDKVMDFINSDSWQSRTKALMVVAQLVKARGCERHLEWWAANAVDEISGMTSDPKPSVRTQALKTMKALKISSSTSSQAQSLSYDDEPSNVVPSASAGPTQAISLLDVDEDYSTASPGSGSGSGSGNGDLFAGMAVGTASPTHSTVPPAAAPLSSNPALNTSNQIDLLFDGLEPSLPPPPRPPTATQPALDPSQNTSPAAANVAPTGFDFLQQGNVNSSSPVPSSQQNPSSLYPNSNLATSSFSGLSTLMPQPGPQDLAYAQLAAQNAMLQQQQLQMQIQMQQMQHMNLMRGTINPAFSRPPGPAAGPALGMGMGVGSRDTGLRSISGDRKIIPGINDAQSASGFSFMSGASGSTAKKPEDSFSFVTDAMRASNAKK